jgi:5-formyltetrahydrofolate cyclo-ligase
VADHLKEQKAELRTSLRARLRVLTETQVEEWGQVIQDRIVGSPLFEQASSLALYHPYQNEVKTQDLFEQAQKRGKRVAYPQAPTVEAPLNFFWIDSLTQLGPTSWGPLGPDPQKSLHPASYESIDLMLVPGLAFDRRGARLGRGKGFYDRTLKIFSGLKLGVAYDFQVLDEVPHSIWDEPVQYLATEKDLRSISLRQDA